MLLHVLGHVYAHQRVFGIEEERRERLAKLALADARGAEEEERAVRAVGIG
jgi:hypothetical protein